MEEDARKSSESSEDSKATICSSQLDKEDLGKVNPPKITEKAEKSIYQNSLLRLTRRFYTE